MTDSGLDVVGDTRSERPGPGRRRAQKQRKNARLARLLVTLTVLVGLIVGLWFAWGKASAWLNGPEDYTGQGTGSVTVEVKSGDNGVDIARTLKEADVVKSVDAFYQLSLRDERTAQVQPGFYELRTQMSAEWAMREITDTANRVEGRVVIPEGSRLGQIVDAIADGSEITAEEVTAALEQPESLGLPDYADDNPEGFLYPATYTVEPGTTAEDLLKQMVAKTIQVEEDLDIAARAATLGITAEEAHIIASLIELEAGDFEDDRNKVSRVIYNRLDDGMALQFDSTVTYLSERKGDVFTTEAERANESLYNTYQHVGLPPGPIGSPGEAAIEAALNPAEGDWRYFVAIDLETGESAFANDFAGHQQNVERLQEYCQGTDAC